MASKSSAVADQEPVDVLFALHDKFVLTDFAGPLEVLSRAQHDIKDPCKLLPTYLREAWHLSSPQRGVLFLTREG